MNIEDIIEYNFKGKSNEIENEKYSGLIKYKKKSNKKQKKRIGKTFLVNALAFILFNFSNPVKYNKATVFAENSKKEHTEKYINQNVKEVLDKKDYHIFGNVTPIILYHGFNGKKYRDPIRQRYQISIDDFKKDLNWLYKNKFQTIPLSDYVKKDFSKLLPLRKPIIITADDAFYEQFIAYKSGDSLKIDKNSMIGALFEFEKKHKEFGHYVTLFIDFDNIPFGQKNTLKKKLNWLINNGIEIGTHTWHHKRLDKLSIERSIREIIEPYNILEKYIGKRIENVRFFAYPYSILPNKKIRNMMKKHKGILYKSKIYRIDYAFLAYGKKFLNDKEIMKERYKVVRKEIYQNNISSVLNSKINYTIKIPKYLERLEFYAY